MSGRYSPDRPGPSRWADNYGPRGREWSRDDRDVRYDRPSEYPAYRPGPSRASVPPGYGPSRTPSPPWNGQPVELQRSWDRFRDTGRPPRLPPDRLDRRDDRFREDPGPPRRDWGYPRGPSGPPSLPSSMDQRNPRPGRVASGTPPRQTAALNSQSQPNSGSPPRRINFLGRDHARALERQASTKGGANGPSPGKESRIKAGGIAMSFSRSNEFPVAPPKMARQSSSPGMANSKSRQILSSPANLKQPQAAVSSPEYEDGELRQSPVKVESWRLRDSPPRNRYGRGWSPVRQRDDGWEGRRRSMSPNKYSRPKSPSPVRPTSQSGLGITGVDRSTDHSDSLKRRAVTASPQGTSVPLPTSQQAMQDRKISSPIMEETNGQGDDQQREEKPEIDGEPRAGSNRPDTPVEPPPEDVQPKSDTPPADQQSQPNGVTEDTVVETEIPADVKESASSAVSKQEEIPSEKEELPANIAATGIASDEAETAAPISEDHGAVREETISAAEKATLALPTESGLEVKDESGDKMKPKSPRRSRSPAPPTATIAERRSVRLMPANDTSASPFRSSTPRKDPMPTAASMATITTAGMDVDDDPMDSADKDDVATETSETAVEEMKRLKMEASIKLAQGQIDELDIDGILETNIEIAPVQSSRIPQSEPEDPDKSVNKVVGVFERERRKKIQRITREASERIKVESEELEAKISRLQGEYKDLDQAWQEHCKRLEAIMEKRGKPPADLFLAPGTLPVGTPMGVPGMIPTTPGDDAFGSRANRRRGAGAGDAVTTEAEFQEILAGLADTAAKDPNYRASKTTAVVPDMILDEEEYLKYEDDNDLVVNPLQFYDFAGKAEPIWTDEERTIFLKRYLSHPKQFGRIAEGLKHKSAAECVVYYYRTKKDIDYKGMLASRRGDKKKKTIPIKKGGKSSALLADLERKKPTVNTMGQQGPKSTLTPNKSRESAKQRAAKDSVSTPGPNGASAGPSRSGSEAPSTSKAKMRMTIKTAAKRPRTSSISEIAKLAEGRSPGGTPLPSTPGAIDSTNPDLLPPVKRPGKRRKAEPSATPTAAAVEGSTPLAEDGGKAKRSSTNSYWSVEEKKKFKDLLKVHGNNVKAIAAELTGKSERQVANYFDAHKNDTEGGDVTPSEVGSRPAPGQIQPGYLDRPAAPATAQYVPEHRPQPRSIYDVYQPGQPRPADSFDRQNPYQHQPRLGTFPTSGPFAATSRLGSSISPPKATATAAPASGPRMGGMPLSAMLNNDSSDNAVAPASSSARYGSRAFDETASDGTVSERDGDNGMIRPSPRQSMVPLDRSDGRRVTSYNGESLNRYDAARRESDRQRRAASEYTPYPPSQDIRPSYETSSSRPGEYGTSPPKRYESDLYPPSLPRASTTAPTIPPYSEYRPTDMPRPHSSGSAIPLATSRESRATLPSMFSRESSPYHTPGQGYGHTHGYNGQVSSVRDRLVPHQVSIGGLQSQPVPPPHIAPHLAGLERHHHSVSPERSRILLPSRSESPHPPHPHQGHPSQQWYDPRDQAMHSQTRGYGQ